MVHSQRGRFVHQIKKALDRGWADWTKQAIQLHTFLTDQENRLKEGKPGFYKLNEDTIVVVHEDFAADYKTLADHHSKEVLQLLEYGAVEIEISHHLHQYEAERKATRLQPLETVELPENPTEEAVTNLQGEPILTIPPNGEPATEGTPEPTPLPVPETKTPPAPLHTTTTVPPQPEPCPATTTELPPQPDLTTEPMTVPLAEPTPEPELPRPDVSEPLHTDDTTQSLETETVALDLPPVTTPTPDPTPPESSILHIFDDA